VVRVLAPLNRWLGIRFFAYEKIQLIGGEPILFLPYNQIKIEMWIYTYYTKNVNILHDNFSNYFDEVFLFKLFFNIKNSIIF
jgi:hypothetical protein